MTRPPRNPRNPRNPKTSQSHGDAVDGLEALLGEALKPDVPSVDLAARIIAKTAHVVGDADQGIPKLRLVGKQPIHASGDDTLVPLLDQALAPSSVPGGLVHRILAATLPIGDQIIARIGPLRLRYATAHRFAAVIVIAAMLGIVVQAWGICTDAYHIVQATRHVSAMMQYTAPDTALDQKIDQLTSEIDQLALGTSHDQWPVQTDEMSRSLMGLEDLVESETNGKTF